MWHIYLLVKVVATSDYSYTSIMCLFPLQNPEPLIGFIVGDPSSYENSPSSFKFALRVQII